MSALTAAEVEELERRVADVVQRHRSLLRRVRDLRQQVEEMSERIARLEGKSRREAKVPLVKETGVCGLNPEIDSAVCPNATVYRHQQGCMGTACTEVNRRYYAEYRAKRRSGQA